jgi:ATP-dependent Lhr-like helicase
MDVDGLLALLAGLEQGTIEKRALDTSVPSAFAHGILSAQPYTFLDDAPLEERRTQAVMTRRTLDPAAADGLGALDPGAIARVREQAWPDPQGLEELHEALLWMGFLTQAEVVRCGWSTWLGELARAGRAEAQPSPAGAAPAEGGRRWFATEAPRYRGSLFEFPMLPFLRIDEFRLLFGRLNQKDSPLLSSVPLTYVLL